MVWGEQGGAGAQREEGCASGCKDNTGNPVRPQETTAVLSPAGDDEGGRML